MAMDPGNGTCPVESESVVEKMDMLDSLLLPCIALFGIVGNLFSVAIFRHTAKLRRLASSVYLISLAFSDSIFLFTLLLSMPALNLLQKSGLCKTIFYFMNCSGVFSSWLVVVFTVERFIVIAYPLTRLARCSRRRAWYFVLFLLPVPVLMYVYTAVVLIDVDPITLKCHPKEDHLFVITILHSVDISITYFIPASIVVALNVRIGLQLMRSNVERCYMRSGSVFGTTSDAVPSGASNARTQETPPRNRSLTDSMSFIRPSVSISSTQRVRLGSALSSSTAANHANENSITRTLIVISTSFALLNLPHNVVLLVKLTSDGHCFARSDFMYILTSVCYALYYANFGVNIVVYHLTSSNYRKGAKEFIGRWSACLSSFGRGMCRKRSASDGESKIPRSASPTSGISPKRSQELISRPLVAKRQNRDTFLSVVGQNESENFIQNGHT